MTSAFCAPIVLHQAGHDARTASMEKLCFRPKTLNAINLGTSSFVPKLHTFKATTKYVCGRSFSVSAASVPSRSEHDIREDTEVLKPVRPSPQEQVSSIVTSTPATFSPPPATEAPTKSHPGFFKYFPNTTVAYLVSGLMIGGSAGFAGSLVGLGGAFLLIPLMTGVMAFTQHQAHATSLVGVAVTGAIGALTYWNQGMTAPAYAAIMCVTAIITARIGALVASKCNAQRLKKVLGLWWMFSSSRIAWTAIMKKKGLAITAETAIARLPALAKANLSNIVPLARQSLGTTAVLLATGGGAGFLSGLLGVAGGALMVPVLVEAGCYQQIAQGTSLLTCVLPAVVGSYTHAQAGNIVFAITPGLLLGAIVGARFGGKVACMLPEKIMKVIFSSILFYVGSKMAGFIGGPKKNTKVEGR